MSTPKSPATELSTEKCPDDSHSYPEVAPMGSTHPEIRPSPLLQQQQPIYLPQPQGQQPYYYQQHAPEAGYGHPPPKRNPWGLSPVAFGALVAIITALVVGGAVGGGVAGALSGNESSSGPVETVTVTTTGTATAISTGSPTESSGLPLPTSVEGYAPIEPYYIATLAQPSCSSGMRMSTLRGQTFDLYCGMDIGNGRTSDQDAELVVADVVGIYAYAVEDCLAACSNLNYFEDRWETETSCLGITWNSEMASSNSSNYANCWLKNGTSVGNQCNNCISAYLI